MKYLKLVEKITLVQLGMWIPYFLLLVCGFANNILSELFGLLLLIYILASPIVILIYYLKNEDSFFTELKISLFITSIIWLIISILTFIPSLMIVALIASFFIRSNGSGSPLAIGHMLAFLFLTISPLFLVIISKIIKFIYKKFS